MAIHPTEFGISAKDWRNPIIIIPIALILCLTVVTVLRYYFW